MEDALSKLSELYQKARQMMDEGKLEDAVVLFQQSVTYAPHFKTLELLGECFVRLNRLIDAIVPLYAAHTKKWSQVRTACGSGRSLTPARDRPLPQAVLTRRRVGILVCSAYSGSNQLEQRSESAIFACGSFPEA
jgi:hypothetical protein